MKKELTAFLALSLILGSFTACNTSKSGLTRPMQETNASTEIEAEGSTVLTNNVASKGEDLSETDYATLMDQIADNDLNRNYEIFLPDELFANADIFCSETKENENIAYALLSTGEYVVLKERAYYMSGGSGLAVIKYIRDEEGVKLLSLEWGEDGEELDKWIKNNIPDKYQDVARERLSHSEKNLNALDEKVEEELGTPVEKENLLTIEENGTYKIEKTMETGSPEKGDYKFDVKTLEEGNLKE